MSAACGDDDDAAPEPTTTASTAAAAVPDENPCAEGGSGTFIPPTDPAPGATAVEVTAEDLAFVGADALAVGGELAVTLTNADDELHEIVVQRLDADESRSIAELLQSEEDPATFATGVGAAFACPGASSVPNRVDATVPGRYVALCFIPTGLTAETSLDAFDELGPPHAFQGMVAEFQVGG